jgi:hypothetical protein
MGQAMTVTCAPVQQDFLITGHGRSGTNYMAHLFNWFGFRVGARQLGHNGMAHNFPPAINPMLWPFTEVRRYYAHLIHVVRNPWKVVESSYAFDLSLPDEHAKVMPGINDGNELDRTIRSVVLWNRAIREAEPDLTVKVEEAMLDCEDWLRAAGFLIRKLPLPPPPTNVNGRSPDLGFDMEKTVNWDDAGDAVMELFSEHCAEYGYEVPA